MAPEIRELHLNAAHVILRDKDIHRVHGLHIKEDGSFLYMAATAYATFPKYVIGHANAELTSAEILVQCGEEWNAQSEWTRVRTLPRPEGALSPDEIAKAVEDEVRGVAQKHGLPAAETAVLLASTFGGLLVQLLADPGYQQTLITRFTK